MEFFRFISIAMCIAMMFRLALANWMAVNRPLEGKTAHWTDGVFDFFWFFVYGFLLHNLLF